VTSSKSKASVFCLHFDKQALTLPYYRNIMSERLFRPFAVNMPDAKPVENDSSHLKPKTREQLEKLALQYYLDGNKEIKDLAWRAQLVDPFASQREASILHVVRGLKAIPDTEKFGLEQKDDLIDLMVQKNNDMSGKNPYRGDDIQHNAQVYKDKLREKGKPLEEQAPPQIPTKQAA